MQGHLTRDNIFELAYSATLEAVRSTPGFIEELSFRKEVCPGEPDLYEPENDTSFRLLIMATGAAQLHGGTTLSEEDIYKVAEEVYVRSIIELGLVSNIISFDPAPKVSTESPAAQPEIY